MSENTMERLPGASGFPATGIDLTTGRTTVARVTVEKLRVPISVAYVLVLVALVLSSASVWEAHSPLVCSSLFCLGIFLAGVGSLGRVWCSLYIGGRKTRTLVCDGPYSLCRNPLYFFSLLGVMGVGFASETLVVPGILVLGFAAYYPFVVRAEENKLLRDARSAIRAILPSRAQVLPAAHRLERTTALRGRSGSVPKEPRKRPLVRLADRRAGDRRNAARRGMASRAVSDLLG